MATIVLIEHELQDRLGIPYMAHDFARRWEARGHRVLFHRGVSRPPPGDLAILHVDLTVVPESYRDLARHFSRTLNFRAWDIRKSRYSTAKVSRGDAWAGKVMIKSEGNHGGYIDDTLRRMSLAEGRASDVEPLPVLESYYLCDSIARVPSALWDTPGVIVEKFVPELAEGGGYHLRVWTFCGSQSRSTRYLAHEPLIRARNYVSREPVEVPEAIRAWREKLGFEMGKFDYVLHEGEYILLDANRTPSAPAYFADNPEIEASFDRIARGIEDYL